MRRIFLPLLVLFIFSLFVFPSGVSAKFLSDENGTVSVAKNEQVDDDLFIKAQTAEIDGIVNGDVFIGAQTVRIDGIINGSLYIGGQIISISGDVKGNVYIGGQDISFTGSTIGGSLFAGGQNLNFDTETVIRGSLYSGGSSLKLDSQIGRNAYLGMGVLTLEENTTIGNNLYYAGQEGKVSISPKALIEGSIHKSETNIPEDDIKNAEKNIPLAMHKLKIVGTFFAFLSALLVGLIYLKLFEKHFTQTAGLVSKNLLKSIGVGFLAIIAFVPGFVILLITVIGIPIAGLSLLIFLIYLYMAKIIVGMALGNLLVKKFDWKMSVFSAFTVGLFALYLVKIIPFVGGIVECFAVLCGLGALILQSLPKSKTNQT